MCGIVSFIGPEDGLEHVLDALELLAYRAPDSSGVAIVDDQGKLAVRRSVGTAWQLRLKLQDQPLPTAMPAPLRVVAGHGRWAMVGAVTEANAHPIADRGQNRVICENGSHNASLMLAGFAAQEAWWRQRGLAAEEPVHRTANSSEVLVYEWERLVADLAAGRAVPGSQAFLDKLDLAGIDDPEERGLRLALWRFRQGNAHACAFYSRFRPETLYISSHNKPIALARRTDDQGRQSLMAASDVNAALMLWPKAVVDQVEARWQQAGLTPEEAGALKQLFTVEVIFLDHHLGQGEELFARIGPARGEQGAVPQIALSRYDGSPLLADSQPVRLSPMRIGRQLYDSYTEGHIAEIPEVMRSLAQSYIRQGQVHLEASPGEAELEMPGLNLPQLEAHFGRGWRRLQRLLLIGEGSSWRNALAAAPLFRRLVPELEVRVYRPVEMLNLGVGVDPAADLALEISWSGTTDSLLKVDKWLAGLGVRRAAVTGRPQSDLGRRTQESGGTINVLTGMELSVATVKGYQAILMTLNLLALQLAALRGDKRPAALPEGLIRQLAGELPERVRQLIEDEGRQERLRAIGQRCAPFNKIMVVGDSPVVVEAELKIEELCRVVAGAADFSDSSLLPLIERSAGLAAESSQVLFIVNATSRPAWRRARPLLERLIDAGLCFVAHTQQTPEAASLLREANCEWVTSPEVGDWLQPLIDAPFYFQLAVAMAYGRGLSPDQIDQPRNLAKSVTTTGAEPRSEVESRPEFQEISMAEYSAAGQPLAGEAAEHSPLAYAAVDWAGFWSAWPAGDEATRTGLQLGEAAWQAVTGQALRLQENGRAGLAPRPAGREAGEVEQGAALDLIQMGLRCSTLDPLETERWEMGLGRLQRQLQGLGADAPLGDQIGRDLRPFVEAGYDKWQIIGGGQDQAAALGIAHRLRAAGFMAEALYSDSAWHGPLAAVGGPDADHDTLILILATDPLFQAAALVDTQVYRSRLAHPFLVLPGQGLDLSLLQGVQAAAIWQVPAAPRPYQPLLTAALGSILARQMAQLWDECQSE